MEHIRNFAVGLNVERHNDDILIGRERVNRVRAAYGFGLFLGAATAVIAGGVYANAKIEEAAAESREAALKCIELELRAPGVSSSGTTMQTIIARCRDKAAQQDLP